MFERTVESLGEEYAELGQHEQRCHELIGLLEDEHSELEVSDYFHKASLATLERLSDTIALRRTQVRAQVEEYVNQPLDNFRRRQID